MHLGYHKLKLISEGTRTDKKKKKRNIAKDRIEYIEFNNYKTNTSGKIKGHYNY